MKKSNFLWSFIIIIILLSISGAVVIAKKINTPDETEKLKAKTKDEMNYLDGKITSMINSLNNIVIKNYIVQEKQVNSEQADSPNDQTESSESGSSSEGKDNKSSSGQSDSSQQQPKNITEMVYNNILSGDKKIDWTQLETEVENLHSSWATILLDLYKLDLNKDNILKFSQLLDQLTLNVKSQKKDETLNSLTQMYSCIVGYIDSFSQDDLYKNIAKTKESIFYSYMQVDEDNWQEVEVQLQNAENSYLNVVNNIHDKEKEFSINKAYIALKELQNCVTEKDADIFYIKYKNLLEELDLLMG